MRSDTTSGIKKIHLIRDKHACFAEPDPWGAHADCRERSTMPAYRCTVPAGEFVDLAGMFYRLPDYVDGMNAEVPPSAWSLHAYNSAHAGYDKAARRINQFLNKIKSTPKLWLTEQGGRVHKHGVARAEQDFCTALTLRKISDRITRFYGWEMYQPPDRTPARFDSALIGTRETRNMYRNYRFYTAKEGTLSC